MIVSVLIERLKAFPLGAEVFFEAVDKERDFGGGVCEIREISLDEDGAAVLKTFEETR